jgi:hypothetical protein
MIVVMGVGHSVFAVAPEADSEDRRDLCKGVGGTSREVSMPLEDDILADSGDGEAVSILTTGPYPSVEDASTMESSATCSPLEKLR